MPGVNTAEKVTVPAPGDPFDYMGEIRRLANSQRTIVSVANRAEADVIAAAMATDNRPVTDANPLVVYNVALKTVEVKSSSGWNDTGRTIKHAEFASTFTIAGGNVNWDVGPLTQTTPTQNNTFCNTTGALSGAINFTESGWYAIDSLSMPDSNPGVAMVTMNMNGNNILTSGMTTGYMWEISTCVSLVYVSAGTYIRWTATMTTQRSTATRVRITKWG